MFRKPEMRDVKKGFGAGKTPKIIQVYPGVFPANNG